MSAVGSAILATDAFPRADLLIESGELAKPEVVRQFVILDVRSAADYAAGHLPSARWVDHSAWAKAFGDGKDATGWSKRIGELGIASDAKVVIYDASYKDAARIWWILRYWGVEDVRLLHGGWPAWKAAGLPVETITPKTTTPLTFAGVPRTRRLATKQQLLDALKTDALQIIDARSEAEYCGTEPASNKRAGAIPGAKHLDWVDLIDKDTQRFKDAQTLRKLFQDSGIDLTKPSATHCQSGGRSSVMAFAMELMGAGDVSNYYASWGEWGNADDTPIVPGKKKK